MNVLVPPPMRFGLILGILSLLIATGSARANMMMLTPTAIADGFNLTTFASGFPHSPAGENQDGGPFGIAFPGNGTVLVSDLNGAIYVFPKDADGQTVSQATVGAQYGAYNPLGMTQNADKVYLGFQSSNVVDLVNSSGAPVSTLAFIPGGPHGMAINPMNGNVLVSSDSGTTFGAGIWEVNPTTGNVKNIVSGFSFDGITVGENAGQTIVYAARADGEVLGFDISTGQQVFDAGTINIPGVFGFGTPGVIGFPGDDGLALGTGALAGNLYINTNYGDLIQVNLDTKVQTLIGTGGSRGDFVTVDPTNGTLLLDQTDSVLRLTAPAGGGFGAPTPTPEPSSFVLLGLGIALLAIFGWRRGTVTATSTV